MAKGDLEEIDTVFFFTELIHNFKTQLEEVIMVKVLLRIMQVLEMQKLIAAALSLYLSFTHITLLI